MPDEKLYSTAEAAKFLGVSVKTIKRWRKTGKLVPTQTRDNGYSGYTAEQLGTFMRELGTTGDIPQTGDTSKLGTRPQSGDNVPTLTRDNQVGTPSKSGDMSLLREENHTIKVGTQTRESGENQTRDTQKMSPLVTPNVTPEVQSDVPLSCANDGSEVQSTAVQKRYDQKTKQERIAEAERFFNQLFGRVAETKFSYLWTKQGEAKATYPFDVSTADNRAKMARKAIELSDAGADVYVGVNLVDEPLPADKRATNDTVTVQTATITDIDVEGGTHVSTDKKKYPPTFDVAQSFLPFDVSLLVDSGYGLHGYCIYSEPIRITDENRDACIARNKKFISVIRNAAAEYSGAVDGVGDLPRVLRVPGTFNYKCARDNAPLCRLVMLNDIHFTPEDIDARLNAATPAQAKSAPREHIETSARRPVVDYAEDSPEYKRFRIEHMLPYINVAKGDYDKWLDVGFGLFNEGMELACWEQWSRTQPFFKEGECESKWQGFHHDPAGIKIGSLHNWAIEGGYSEKETQREWYQLHPELSQTARVITGKSGQKILDNINAAQADDDSLEAKLRDVTKALADFDAEKDAALKSLCNVEKFDSDTVFADEIVTAAAFARLFDEHAFSDFRRSVKSYGDKHKDQKADVNTWVAAVRTKANEINSRRADLVTKRNEITAQIKSRAFAANHDILEGIVIPKSYSISAERGIEKVEGERLINVCRRPVIITGKTFSVEEKIYKLSVAFMRSSGKWKNISPTERAVLSNRNKIVDLANDDLPVTTENSRHLVEYLDAFLARNENNFPLTYSVARCGWYSLSGKDFFVDPRRNCSVTNSGKNISVKVDSQSVFANSLRAVGSLEEWKKAYQLAKKSPVARLVVAASVAPPLLKILGERNFLLYIYASTLAGKTTALYLGASAVGDEKIIRSFDATKNGLAGAAADVNDYPLLIDEKQVADNRLKECFSDLIYALANGVGRTKLNKNSTLKKLQDWRTIPIMTGETLLLPDNVTGGANSRLLTISAPKVILDADSCKDIRTTIAENYGHVFPLVVDKILELGRDNLRGWYQSIVKTFIQKYPELLNEYCRYMAVLTLADGLLNSALGAEKALADAKLAAQKIFPLIPTTAEISDTAREKDFVLGFIAQNQSRFIGGNIPLDRMQSFYGKLEDKEYVYITAKSLQEACDTKGFDYRKLVDDLVADGFFVPGDKVEKGRRTPLSTVKKRLGEVNARCYRIPLEALEDNPGGY